MRLRERETEIIAFFLSSLSFFLLAKRERERERENQNRSFQFSRRNLIGREKPVLPLPLSLLLFNRRNDNERKCTGNVSLKGRERENERDFPIVRRKTLEGEREKERKVSPTEKKTGEEKE